MPLVKVQTSAPSPDPGAVEQLLSQLSSLASSHLDRPERYAMTALNDDVLMSFAADLDVEVKSVGQLSASQTQAITSDFCTLLGELLGVSAERIYISFTPAEGHLWGWDGTASAEDPGGAHGRCSPH